MRRASATAVALSTLALSLAACLLNRSGNADGGAGGSSVATVSTGFGGASSSSGKGGGGGMGEGGVGAGGKGGMGVKPLDCSSTDLWACYNFDNNVNDQAGPYNWIGVPTEYVTNSKFSAFDVVASGQHTTLGPNMPASPALEVEELTIELCFFAKSLPATAMSMSLYRTKEWAQLYIRKTTDNDTHRLRFQPGNGNLMANNGELQVNKWYHGAAVYSAAAQEVIVYVSGLPATMTSTNATIGLSAFGTTLGHRLDVVNAVDVFDGYIDNLRVFHSVRTPTEIADAAANCPKKNPTPNP